MSNASAPWVGCTLRPPEFPGITSQQGADNYWINTVGLPLQVQKTYYTGTFPTSIGEPESTLISSGIAFVPCFEASSTTGPWTTDVANMKAALNMFLNAGAIIPCTVLYNEVNTGKLLTAAQFLAIVSAFQGVRSIVPLYPVFAGHVPTTIQSYWKASLFDGVGLDQYAGTGSNNSLATCDTLARNAGVPLGIFETGSQPDSTATTRYTNWMSSLTTTFNQRATDGQESYVAAWYNGAQGQPSVNTITSASDSRIPAFQQFLTAFQKGVPGSGSSGPYDVCNGSVSSGTTLAVGVGSGSLGSPQATTAGDLVVVVLTSNAASQTVSGVSDGTANTYTLVNSYSAGSSQNHWVYASLTTVALPTTKSITATFGSSSGTKSMVVRGCPNIVSVVPDIADVANGTGVTPDVSTATLSSVQEWVVGAIADGGASGIPTGVSLGTGTAPTPESLVNGNTLTVADQLVTSKNAITLSGTLSSSRTWSGSVTTFKVKGFAPNVTTTSEPSGVVGTAYNAGVAAKGGTLPYSWALTTGSMPPGLTLNTDGSITGTPTTAGTYTFTATATDANSDTATSGSLSIVITASGVAVTTGALASGTTGAAYAGGPETASGGTSPYTWLLSSGALPPGISLSSAGAFSGTPTTVGTYSFVVQVTDNTGATALSGTQTITINPPGGVSTAIAAIGIDVPGVSQAGHDKAVVAHGSSTAPSVASSVLSQPEEQCIAFIADASAGGNPTWGGGFTSLGNQADGGSHLILSAAYQTVTAVTSVTASGTITSAAWSAAILTYEVNAPSLNTILSNGVEGDPYNQTLETTGGLGTYTYSITGGTLPPGLTLASGVISGTPTTAGEYTFTVTATDAHGFAAAQPEDVTIVVMGASPATAQRMAGNRLTQADSDFESGVGSWTAKVNASNVTTSTNAALTGSQSLRWTATADGGTSVLSGVYTGIEGGKPHVASVYVLATSNQVPNLWVGFNWFDSGGVFISSTSNGGVPLASPLMWQGIQVATVAPANAARVELFVIVDEANAGDQNYIDLAFFTEAQAQVLIDFVNPSFGPNSVAGANFMDVTPFVRMDQGINTQRGRQDAISEISTGSADFNVQNDGGWFTLNNVNSAVVAMGGKVSLGARCQINLTDENGVWYTRYDGPLSQINYTLDPTGNTNLAVIYAADILAELSRQDALECWTKEQVLANGPLYHWSLNDTPNTTQTTNSVSGLVTTTTTSTGLYTLAAESSGNNGPPLKLTRTATTTGAAIAWTDTTGGVETLADTFAPGEPDGSEYWPAGSNVPTSPIRGLDPGTVGPFTTPMQSIYLTPVLSQASAKNAFISNQGYMLQALLPTPLAPSSSPAGDFSVEAWFTLDPSVVANVTKDFGPYTVFSLGSARRGTTTLVAGVFQPSSGNVPQAGAAIYADGPAFGNLNFSTATPLTPSASAIETMAEADTVQIPHHIVVAVQGDPLIPTATVYIDGDQVGTPIFLPPGTTFDTIAVGGAFGRTGCFFGNISMVSIYPFQLSPSQVALDCQLGQYGMWEAPTDDCIAQLASYANIPGFWNSVQAQHNGLSLTDYFDITGNSPYAAMTTYEQTEGGLLFVNAEGQLTFHTRDWRMGYGAPKLTLPPDSYSEQLGLSVLDSYQSNEDAVGSVAFPGGASYVNQGSQDQFGTYATNPVGSPVQLAHISYSRAYGAAGLQEYTFWPDPNMEDAAAWDANSKSDPWLALGGVTVDLLTVDPTWGVNISNFYSVDIDDMLSLGGTLPASLPNDSHVNEYFIEGVAELIQTNARTITYYVSPAATQRAWIPGDAVYGVLGKTTRIGVSQADLSTPQADGKDVSHDGGPPYWAPSFSSTMNSPGNGTGFVGALDMRGLTWPLQQILQPPMAAVATLNNTQSFPTGSNDTPQAFWDTLQCDSVNGMGVLPGWPNWYVCLVPGFYEIDGSLEYGAGASSGGSGLQGWIVVALGAAEQIVSGTGDPTTASAYVCPIGESVRQNSVGRYSTASPTTRMYLGLGDMVTIASEQNTGSTLATGNNSGASRLSVRFVGLGTVDDRAQVNSSINGGTIVNPVPPSHGTNTYTNTHTFLHYGQGAKRGAYELTPSGYDGHCNQAAFASDLATVGPQYTLIRMPWTQMQIDLAGKTLTSVTLHGHCLDSNYKTGVKMLGGYYYTNSEGSTWRPGGQSPKPNFSMWTQWFQRGQSLTFSIPASQFQQYFILNVAHGITMGDNSTSDKWTYGGEWAGGPNSWTLKVSY